MRLRDHALRLLIGDQIAWLVKLEAARQILQAEERFADATPPAYEIHLVRQQSAGAVVEEIDAADHSVGGARRSDFMDWRSERQRDIALGCGHTRLERAFDRTHIW